MTDFEQHGKLQALVQSSFTMNQQQGEDEPNSASRTISINTRLMWDIVLYNLANGRASSASPRLNALFDDSSFFPNDNGDEDEEDIIEMEISHDPIVEVILSNGQALPPQSGQQRNPASVDRSRSLPAGDARQDLQSTRPTAAAALPELDTALSEPTNPSAWPVPAHASPLDVTYDPFFQFQVPGSLFMGTWEVGNL